MDPAQTKIVQLESTIRALEELLTVSETAFLEGAKQLEESVNKHAQLENDVRQILDASGDAIKVIDSDCRIIYANKAYMELKNLKEDIIGRACHEATSEKECFTEDCPLNQISKVGRYSRENYLKMGDESFVPYHITVAPHTDAAGNTIGIIKTYRNIAEEKKARKNAEENAQQQGRIEMSNNMLHDIGNAMTGISAYVLKPQVEKQWQEINSLHQLRGLFNSKKKEMADVLGIEKQHALEVFINALISSLEKRNTDYIASFQKISTAVGHVCSVLDLQRHYMREKSTPLATEINLATIINDTLVMMSSSLQKRNIEVKISVRDSNLTVSGDQTRLIRVFLNIIKNIYEAFDERESTENRKLEITVVSSEERKEITISFRDNAIGFDAETGNNLFTRGFTTKNSGSGIGLHECRSIIESHNGTMTIRSDGKNSGALTVITFPFSNKKKD